MNIKKEIIEIIALFFFLLSCSTETQMKDFETFRSIDAPLIIVNVNTSFGCTTADTTKRLHNLLIFLK